MRDLAFAIPGDLTSPTGGYEYDRRLIALLSAHFRVRHIELPASFPHPTAGDLASTARALADIARDAMLLVDGLAYGAFSSDLVANIRAPIAALVHHPLAYETGLSDACRASVQASERAALARARTVIATSPSTRTILEREYGVPSSRLFVAEPGTDRVERARGAGDVPTILAVGAVSPRKGYDVLVDALRPLADRAWRAVIVGSLVHDPKTAERLRRQIEASGLGDRVRLTGAVSAADLAEFYATADVFVLSSLYEGYGMALADAMTRGLAIVSTTGGAASETVPDGAALKVPPADVRALSYAIARVLADADLRRSLADASWHAGQRLPRWEDTAGIVAAALESAA
ncbi:MAG TPA: glycosyltransferase family 4 protein [Alphaproteobacteria bacterium]|nr:glycosyltransferase family 4 protein [Alphaproteobacteria bacterium]